jgi:hypothetical protein
MVEANMELKLFYLLEFIIPRLPSIKYDGLLDDLQQQQNIFGT